MSTAQDAYRDYYVDAGDPDFHSPRYRWTVETFIGAITPKKILEIGCGNGGCIQFLSDRAEVVGMDASESGVKACTARSIPAILADVSTARFPFEPDTFDLVICLETLEHLANPQHAIDEIRRVLKPNGRFICSIPNPRIGHPYLYPGLFTFKNFKRFLAQNGFPINRIAPWGWAPREAILPPFLRKSRVASSRYVAGVIRRSFHGVLPRLGFFPHFLYWLWTLEAVNVKNLASPKMLEIQAMITRPANWHGSPLTPPSPPPGERTQVRGHLRAMVSLLVQSSIG